MRTLLSTFLLAGLRAFMLLRAHFFAVVGAVERLLAFVSLVMGPLNSNSIQYGVEALALGAIGVTAASTAGHGHIAPLTTNETCGVL